MCLDCLRMPNPHPFLVIGPDSRHRCRHRSLLVSLLPLYLFWVKSQATFGASRGDDGVTCVDEQKCSTTVAHAATDIRAHTHTRNGMGWDGTRCRDGGRTVVVCDIWEILLIFGCFLRQNNGRSGLQNCCRLSEGHRSTHEHAM